MSHYRRTERRRVLALALAVLCIDGWRTHSAGAQRSPSRPDSAIRGTCDTLALGTLTGDVTQLDGSPAIGARVSVFWKDISISADRARVVEQTMRLTTPVGSNGVYRACNIPLATTLLIEVVSADSSRRSIIQSVIDIPNVRFLDLVIGDGSTHSLRGRVVDDNQNAVTGAHVSLVGAEHIWPTDATGAFRIPDVPSGTQMIEVTMLGYEPHHLQVDVGHTVEPIEVNMSHKAVLLDSVKTVAAARHPDALRHVSFESRRQDGFGYFVTAQQIADMHVLSTDEIMRRVPSVRVMLKHTRSGDSLMVTSSRGRVSLESGVSEKPVCTLDIFIDGQRSDASDIQMISPSEIHGIEVHSVATMPAQYHSSQCGAVLIWTK